ncbi:hypothetical protein [Streptomyces europaeiscabiei]|uniref:hypothetical protein n=1 Tax=Streptomyces europaeiscabiei TaxID=146819 RepID=UPI0029B0AFC1|nr:hypothetical protein [Streptomyces europaeiscabiei]MDX3613069.1 hypothetical protein [Streptomyces europaeiscabiei]
MGVRPGELWSRFDWATGNCFRCEQTNVPVAEVGEIAMAGTAFPLCACQRCVFRLEQLHWTMSERAARQRNAPAPGQPSPLGQWPTKAPLNRPPAHVA